MPRAESPTVCSEHDHADSRVRGEAVEGRLQWLEERTGERVDLAGTVERQRGYAVLRLGQHQSLGLRGGIRCHVRVPLSVWISDLSSTRGAPAPPTSSTPSERKAV